MIIDFNGQIAIVTGGAGGIGRTVVQTLLESNAKVAIVDLKGDALDKAVEDMAVYGDVKGFPVDLCDVASIGSTVTAVREAMGEVSILVQCAGIMGGGPGLEVTQKQWDLAMGINSRGLFFMMQEVVKQSMQKIGGGAIVNFSSMAGIRGMNPPMCSAWYSASKGAVVASTMQAAVEWAGMGIRVNAIAPGGVETPSMRAMGIPAGATDPIPMKKLNQPEDIANCVAFLVSDKAAMITGQTLVIDGGASVVGF